MKKEENDKVRGKNNKKMNEMWGKMKLGIWPTQDWEAGYGADSIEHLQNGQGWIQEFSNEGDTNTS